MRQIFNYGFFSIFLIVLIGLAYVAVIVFARDPRCPEQDDGQTIFYPHDTSCKKFYTCLPDGELAEMDCADGLIFDSELQVSQIR